MKTSSRSMRRKPKSKRKKENTTRAGFNIKVQAIKLRGKSDFSPRRAQLVRCFIFICSWIHWNNYEIISTVKTSFPLNAIAHKQKVQNDSRAMPRSSRDVCARCTLSAMKHRWYCFVAFSFFYREHFFLPFLRRGQARLTQRSASTI